MPATIPPIVGAENVIGSLTVNTEVSAHVNVFKSSSYETTTGVSWSYVCADGVSWSNVPSVCVVAVTVTVLNEPNVDAERLY